MNFNNDEKLYLQTTCVWMPKWLLSIFSEIDDNAKEIKLNEFIKYCEVEDELVKEMKKYKYDFHFYKGEYNNVPVYYYTWSCIEHFYFPDDEDSLNKLKEDLTDYEDEDE